MAALRTDCQARIDARCSLNWGLASSMPARPPVGPPRHHSQMEKHIACLVKACRALGLAYEPLDREGNFLRVDIGDHWEYFQLSKTPFNSEVMHGICRDKMHSYQLLNGSVRMPRTLSFLDVELEEKYRDYLELDSLDAILERIEREFRLSAGDQAQSRLSRHQRASVPRPLEGASRPARRSSISDPSTTTISPWPRSSFPTREEFRLVCAFAKPVLTYRRGSGQPVQCEILGGSAAKGQPGAGPGPGAGARWSSCALSMRPCP